MNRLISTIVFGLVTINTVIQADPTRPRLVVGIVVDQLRTDYIEYLRTYFGEKGFKRLMRDGTYFRDVDFKARGLDAAGATAMLYTGAYPSKTGVPAATVYDHTMRKSLATLADPSALGNFTDDSYSPVALRLSTISDELAVESAGLSAIYAFAADPQQAVIMAGHSATSGSWINDNTGNWATTTYYKELPSPLSNRNYTSPLSQRIDTMKWVPSRSITSFPGLAPQKRVQPFQYNFRKRDREVYRMFEASALVNTEVTDVAIDCIKTLNIGSAGDAIDMLNIAYTAAPYPYVKDGDYRAELEDTYFRLDAQLGRLFDAIDKYVGLDNTLVWLSSTGYFKDTAPADPAYKIPGGEFSTKRAKSLLNAYFSANYGNGDYVEAFSNGHVYLNHKEIERKMLSVDKLAEEARAFLCRMSGVADAYTATDILSPRTPEVEILRLSFDPKTGGDVVVAYHPGWTVSEDIDFPTTASHIRETSTLTPAFIMGPMVNSQTIETPVDAVALAPTLAGILRIRSPNGASAKPLM